MAADSSPASHAVIPRLAYACPLSIPASTYRWAWFSIARSTSAAFCVSPASRRITWSAIAGTWRNVPRSLTLPPLASHTSSRGGRARW